jgi:putative FmdB family regulatory protein
MPIYEYYCGGCHTILNFFSRTMNPGKAPSCPHCGKRKLARQVSLFAAGRRGGGGDGESEGPDGLPVDASRMERAMESLASEAESMGEDDPKAAAQLMRKFSKMAGMEFNGGVEQALQRMEAGEDPEAIEADMGEVLDDADPFVVAGGTKAKPRAAVGSSHRGAPRRDETLHDLE